MEDTSEEEICFPCQARGRINGVEDLQGAGRGQVLNYLDIEEDGGGPTSPSAALAKRSAGHRTAEAAYNETTPEWILQLDQAREMPGQTKAPTSWAGPRELALIFQHDLEETKAEDRSSEDIGKKLQAHCDNLKLMEAKMAFDAGAAPPGGDAPALTSRPKPVLRPQLLSSQNLFKPPVLPEINEVQRTRRRPTYWGWQPSKPTGKWRQRGKPYFQAPQSLRTRCGHSFVFMTRCKAWQGLHRETPTQAWQCLVYRKWTA
ncbi:unnamed protein product [Prorocentrum cordatum]|uniref:AP2/ERF domain-containing protein n=1 Tax=Prorocentrum cordatum TaxID=2364126 RepID=A0ABN9RMY2_9DINO|nr:unnamed protein product [Polarella glacialis]